MSVMQLYKWGRKLKALGVPVVPGLIRQAMRVAYQCYIPFTTEIGEGTRFGYNAIGNFIHPKAKFGKNCIVSMFVVVGGREGLTGGAQIGDYVRIGAGAKILGPITIGDFAVIGANAVVTKDVPPGAIVGGVPARVLRRMEDPATEYERATGIPVPIADRLKAPRYVQATEGELFEVTTPGGGTRNVLRAPGTPKTPANGARPVGQVFGRDVDDEEIFA